MKGYLFCLCMLVALVWSVAHAEEKPAWMEYKNPYIGEQSNLANPHRSNEEIINWSEQKATDFLTFTPEDIQEKLKGMKKAFIEQGWISYASYLSSSKLYDMVQNKRYSVATITNGRAVVVGGGAVSGIYHWIVSVPMLVTFIKIDAEGKKETVGSGRYTLTLQVGRLKEGEDENGLAIESWELKRDASAS